MVKKRGLEVALGVSLAVILALSFVLTTLSRPYSEVSGDSALLKYNSMVCVYKNGELINCDHNVLFNLGKNFTRDVLGAGALMGPFQNISLCNASTACGAPAADASEGFTGYANCGLSSQAGSYAALQGSPGNWTITKTFTSTCDNVLTNVTRLTNVTGGLFAGNSFTLVTLQTNDQLTINWTLMIS